MHVKRILNVLIFLGFFAVIFIVLFAVIKSSRDTTSPALADESFVIQGQPTTCSSLFGEPCDFDLQTEYNMWGDGLESFVDSGVLGPYAADIGFVDSAKLSLQACGVNRTAGKTVLEFEDLAQRDHPDATRAQLFPFWNETRQDLCP